MPDPTPEIVITELGGNCPVQAEGTIDGVPFYFRARGDSWRIEIGPGNTAALVAAMDAANPHQQEALRAAQMSAREAVERLPVWTYEEDYGPWPDAGWISEDEARAFIAKGAALWRATPPPNDA